MVTFKKDGFVIEVHTGALPADGWLALHQSLCDIIRNVNRDNIVDDTFYAAVDFLGELMPDDMELRKLIPKE